MNATELKPVHVTRFYSVSPETVFQAWTTPEIMRKWLFVGPTSEIVNIESELKLRGSYSILELESRTGEYIDHFGEYLEIISPRRLVFTLSVPKHFPETTRVIIEIEEQKGGCELSLTQTGISPEVTEANWREMLHKLSDLIEVEENNLES